VKKSKYALQRFSTMWLNVIDWSSTHCWESIIINLVFVHIGFPTYQTCKTLMWILGTRIHEGIPIDHSLLFYCVFFIPSCSIHFKVISIFTSKTFWNVFFCFSP
jgi:hypothetical protein